MSEFTIIETQEQFDKAIGERLKRDRAKYESDLRAQGWKSPDELPGLTEDLQNQINSLKDAAAAAEKTLAEKDAQIAEGAKYKSDLEKTRIALAAGLKIEYADRLRGNNAEEWEADAQVLAKDFATSHVATPLANPEPVPTKEGKEQAVFMQLAKSLRKDG